MSFFDLFRKSADPSRAQIKYGSRGEGIIYRVSGKEAEFQFTWINGNRIYTETIIKWKDGNKISEAEKKTILVDLLRFTKGWFRKSIVVINTDDPSQSLWKQVCTEMVEWVKEIEYSSDETNQQFERQMYVEQLDLHGSVIINDILIHDENQMDEVLSILSETNH